MASSRSRVAAADHRGAALLPPKAFTCNAGELPRYVEVVVEVPRGSLVKRRPDGSVDFVSPLPSPFNYGSVPAIPAADGDPLDAVVLGERLPYGSTTRQRVVGVVKFMDAGLVDNKLICCQPNVKMKKRELLRPSSRRKSSVRESIDSYLRQDLSVLDYFALTAFFKAYALFKTALNACRGRAGRTAFHGLSLSSSN